MRSPPDARVLATRVGGLVEQLEGSPLATLCDPDAASLAAALQGMLERPRDLVAPGDDARQTWRAFAADLLTAIEPLSAARASRIG